MTSAGTAVAPKRQEPPPGLRPATEPPEARGLARDEVALLVPGPESLTLDVARNLPRHLRAGDLLVANRSALRPAAVPGVRDAAGGGARFLAHLATRYGPDLWLVEPRVSMAEPGPIPLRRGERLSLAGVPARALEPYPGVARMWFVRGEGDLDAAAARSGEPVRYGYLRSRPGPGAYATVFGDRPGSAEMASAGRPFTPAMLDDLGARGVRVARVTLHAGVSGLDAPDRDEDLVVPPEPFEVDAEAASAVNRTRSDGGRVIAVGTGAARALESAWTGRRVAPRRGWTAKVLTPGRASGVLDGILTGLHEPGTSHVRLLAALTSEEIVQTSLHAATAAHMYSHEFGDLQLLWRPPDAGATTSVR